MIYICLRLVNITTGYLKGEIFEYCVSEDSPLYPFYPEITYIF